MTTVAHTALGLLGWQVFTKEKTKTSLLVFVLMASLPDIDFALFFFLGRAGFELHQYYTHNIFFVGLTACLFWPLLNSTRTRLGLLLVGYSHLLLDYLTIDGSAPFGIPLLYPFSNQRFHFGFLPNIYKANPSAIFSMHNVWVLAFEITVFWIPMLLAYRKPLTAYFLKNNLQPR